MDRCGFSIFFPQFLATVKVEAEERSGAQGHCEVLERFGIEIVLGGSSHLVSGL